MRISTSQIFNMGSSRLLDGQSNLYKIQNQLATGKKFLSAQDDPVAAAQALITSHTMGVNTQHIDNQGNAASQLGLEETRLQSVVDSLQYVMEQTLAGANDSLSDNERKFFANELQHQLEFMLGMANSTDTNGYYLFSGYKGDTKPFQQLTPNSQVQYMGDDGQRLLQVGTTRQIAVSDSGRDIFQAIRTGNGTFTTLANSSNTGTGQIGGDSVNDIRAWNGRAYDSYQIVFDPGTPPTTFSVNDGSGTPIAGMTNVAYTSGSDIAATLGIPGISFSIKGEPQAGDTFTVAPSSEQSIFTTLQNLIQAFDTPTATNPTAKAQFRNTLDAEMKNLAQTLTRVSSVQASIGARRKEIAELTDVSQTLDVQYKERLSNLEDIDWAKTISDFTQQQTQLEAAQSSFAKISSLNLFNYLR